MPLASNGETARGRRPGRSAPDGTAAVSLARLTSERDAIAVLRRKVPGAEAVASEVFHPFWWARLQVRTRGLFPRRRAADDGGEPAGTVMNVLVNAHSGRSFIADFEPTGEEIDGARWQEELDRLGDLRTGVSAEDAQIAARALVRTKVVKTVKLGMRIDISPIGEPTPVLKPNWLVEGANGKFSARFLVDGLDGTHYVIRAEKL